MPGEASGSTTLNSRSNRPAPSVRAACSRPRSAASRDSRTARTITGNVITAQARLAPAVVNTSRTPNQSYSADPTGPRMPKMISSSQPVTTGGSASGRCTSALSNWRPGKRVRANTQAVSTASGNPKLTARAATASVNRTASHSSGDRARLVDPRLFDLKAALHEHLARLRAGQEGQQGARLRGVVRLDHGKRIRHRIVAAGWESSRHHHGFRYCGVGGVDDAGGRLAAFHQQQRRSDVVGSGQAWRDLVPPPQLPQRLLGVDADGDMRGIAGRQPAVGAEQP